MLGIHNFTTDNDGVTTVAPPTPITETATRSEPRDLDVASVIVPTTTVPTVIEEETEEVATETTPTVRPTTPQAVTTTVAPLEEEDEDVTETVTLLPQVRNRKEREG